MKAVEHDRNSLTPKPLRFPGWPVVLLTLLIVGVMANNLKTLNAHRGRFFGVDSSYHAVRALEIAESVKQSRLFPTHDSYLYWQVHHPPLVYYSSILLSFTNPFSPYGILVTGTLMFAVLLLMLYRLGAAIMEPPLAVAGVGLVALSPLFGELSLAYGLDLPLAGVLLLFIMVLRKLPSPFSIRWALIVGLLVALGFLTKLLAGVFTAPLVLSYVVVRRTVKTRRAIARSLALMTLLILLLISPWYLKFGATGCFSILGDVDRYTTSDVDQFGGWFKTNTGRFITTALLDDFGPVVLLVGLGLSALIGSTVHFRKEILSTGICALMIFACYPMNYSRNVAPILPVLVVYALAGCRARFSPRAISTITGLILGAQLLAWSLWRPGGYGIYAADEFERAFTATPDTGLIGILVLNKHPFVDGGFTAFNVRAVWPEAQFVIFGVDQGNLEILQTLVQAANRLDALILVTANPLPVFPTEAVVEPFLQTLENHHHPRVSNDFARFRTQYQVNFSALAQTRSGFSPGITVMMDIEPAVYAHIFFRSPTESLNAPGPP